MSNGAVYSGIVLAAGASSRLGFPKQLLLLDGETLLHRTARLAVNAGLSPVFVVLGSGAAAMQSALNSLPVKPLINDEWESGMASSLRTGLTAIDSHTTHVLLLVCDQVGLTAAQLELLLSASQANPGTIIASCYDEKVGVPAIFPARFFAELGATTGDRGARELLRNHAAELLTVPFELGAQDIDTAGDMVEAGLKNPLEREEE